MKYLVMECHETYAVLLDETAGFVKAVNADYTVGQTIENPELLKTAAPQRNIIMKVTYGIAAIAACAMLALGIGHYQEYYAHYSSVRLSINPDVEMELNRHGEVLSLAGLNADGEALIAGYDPDRQDKTQVSADLIDRAIEEGFLADGAVIVFEIDTPDAELFQQYGIELRSSAAARTQGLSNVEIAVLEQGEVLETQPDTYDEIVITIPTQPTSETAPAETIPVQTPAPSVIPTDGDDDDDNAPPSGNTVTTASPATTPPATQAPVVQAPVGDSGYGDSGYDAVDDGDSGYE